MLKSRHLYRWGKYITVIHLNIYNFENAFWLRTHIVLFTFFLKSSLNSTVRVHRATKKEVRVTGWM